MQINNLAYFSDIYIQNYSEIGEVFSDRIEKAKKDLDGVNFLNTNSAIDIGCGPGAYSIALSNLGFSEIHAVDFCRDIFHQDLLRNNHIKIHTIDIRQIEKLSFKEMDFILCTGDTILYLNGESEIDRLFSLISEMLNAEGQFLLKFRDFSVELPFIERFKTSKATDSFIKNIGLIYEKEYLYTVDLINKIVDGKWITEKGQSKKYRLSFEKSLSLLEKNGMKVKKSSSRNMNIEILAKKE